MKKLLRILSFVISLASAGCVALPTQPRLETSNPASPKASEAPFVLATPVLTTVNNYAMSPEGEGQPMEMDMKMDMKDMKGMKMNMPEHGGKPMKAPEHEGHEKSPARPKGHEHHEDSAPKQ